MPTKPSARKSTTKIARRATKRVAGAAEQAARKSRKATARRKATAARKKASTPKSRTTRPASQAKPDAIALLKQDHRHVEQLFKRFEKAGDSAHREKRTIVDTVILELSRHAAIEELVFYPAVRQDMAGATSDVLEALEEHHLVKVSLLELEDLDPQHERFDAKVTVLIEHVRHHMKEEEQELFPTVREHIGRNRLRELGAELRAAKPKVATRPHPGAPDEPPGNALVGGGVSVIDRARSAGRRVVDRVMEEVPRS